MIRVLVDGVITALQSRGGVSRLFEEVIHRLAADPSNGIEFLLDLPERIMRLPDGLKERNGLIHLRDYKLSAKYIPRPVQNRLNKYLSPILDRANTSRIAGLAPQIFHSTYYTSPPISGLKTVVTAYDFIDEHAFIGMSGNPPGFGRTKRRVLEAADAVIALSRATKEDILLFTDVDESDITVVHLGVSDIFSTDGAVLEEEIADFRRTYRIGGPYWLYVGRRNPYKNFNSLLRAWQIFRDRYQIDTWLVVTGAYGGLERWEMDFVLSNHLQHRLIMTQAVEDTLLRTIYCGAAAFIFPSLYEGFGIPVLEAFVSGAPCILSDIPVFREIAVNAALYFEPYNDESLAERMMEVFDERGRRDLIVRGRERAKHFSWDKCSRSYADVYKSLV